MKTSVIAALSLTVTLMSANLFAQVAHVAVCQTASGPATPSGASLMSKVLADLGDATSLASLKAIRYTTAISWGTGANQANVEVTQTRVYPDRLVLITRILGGTESENRLEASLASAFVQVSGGSKTNLPDAMRDELLKTVRLDRFYVGQNVGSRKVTVTDTGTERIGDVEAAVLHLNVEGAEATWYVGRADGRLLRTVAKVPVMGGMVDSVVDYSDWRSCDGLIVPFQRATMQGGKASQERVLTVELNPSMTALPPINSVAAASTDVLSDDEVKTKAQDAAALEKQYTTCEKHHIPADKCTPEIYAQLKAKDNAPLGPEVRLGLSVARTVLAQLLNPASFQVRRISVLPGSLVKDGGAYVCVVYGAQAVAGGIVVDSKTFHEKPNKKHPDQPPRLGETLLNFCEVTNSQWMDVTNEVRLALSRQ